MPFHVINAIDANSDTVYLQQCLVTEVQQNFTSDQYILNQRGLLSPVIFHTHAHGPLQLWQPMHC